MEQILFQKNPNFTDSYNKTKKLIGISIKLKFIEYIEKHLRNFLENVQNFYEVPYIDKKYYLVISTLLSFNSF